MFADASALTSMLIDERDAHELLARMQQYQQRVTSPMAVWETVVAVSRELALPIGVADEAVEQFLIEMGIRVIAVPVETRGLAIDAYDRYGKSRHPAALNFGDCFAYACAKHAGMPLLYKGNDFPQTDIRSA
jgi:ribonuclease VapC